MQRNIVTLSTGIGATRSKLKRALWVLAPICCLVGVVTWHEVLADDPPPPEDSAVVVVLDQVTPGSEPDPDPTDDAIITADQHEFETTVDALTSAELLTGVGIITPIEGVVPMPVDVQVWATVYDQATLDYWAQTQYVPAFLNGVCVPEIPTIQEAVFDLDVIAPDADSVIYHMKLCIRNSDGAAAVVFMVPTGGISQITQVEGVRCDAGPWWHRGRICCHVQRLNCTIVRQLLGSYWGPIVCGNCETCFQQCMNCSVSNPCHSCDPCGLSLILCIWFGHC
jgi:hypothetical protein